MWLVRRAIGKLVENEDGPSIGAGAVAEVTYYVALPFVVANDGVAAGEPTECFNPTAALIPLRRYRAGRATSAQSHLAARVILPRAISAMPR